MRKLFIHCGLHKTGTTSLQNIFSTNADALFKQNILYPLTCRNSKANNAHHNIAWLISRDRRYKPEAGDLNTLFQEIHKFDGNIVISSENFESSLLHPNAWKEIIDQANSFGFHTVFIVYFRNPVEYLESIFLENLKHGVGEEFLKILERVARNKRLEIRDGEFCFNYRAIEECMSSIPNSTFLPRNFHSLKNNSLLADFCNTIGIDSSMLSNDTTYWNRRLSIDRYVALFIRNRAHSWFQMNPIEPMLKAAHFALPANARLYTPPPIKRDLMQRLSGDITLASMDKPLEKSIFGTSADNKSVDKNNIAFAIDVRIDRFFSFETYLTMQTIGNMMEDNVSQTFDNQIQLKIKEWREFISASN